MTKDDLKVGYVVKRINGSLSMVMPVADGGKVFTYKNGWFSDFNDYDDDLISKFSNEYTIVEVYGFIPWKHRTFEISTDDRLLLWKREKLVKKMTELELKEHFGLEVEIIDDRKCKNV